MPRIAPASPARICDALNDAIERNEKLVKELERLSNVVGKAGNIKQRAALPSAEGQWATAIESVNTLVSDLVQPTTEVARVIGAVAKGDLSQSMALEIDGRPLTGEFLRTAKVVNTMVDQLGTFASEVTRVAREVGTEGKLGGQAVVKGVAGHLEGPDRQRQLHGREPDVAGRNIAEVTTAVARGDLSKKITGRRRRARILELKNTVNTMVDQLSSFASEVHARGARGRHRGKLGGQAEVKGVAGTWKDLTGQRQPARRQPDGAACGRVARSQPRSRAATSRRRSPSKRAARSCRSRTSSTRWSTSSGRSPRRCRASRGGRHRGKLGRPRPSAAEWRAPGRTSPTTSTRCRQPHLAGPQHREVTTAVARGELSKKITVDVAARSSSEEHHQHDGGPADARSHRKSRASPRMSAPKEARRQAEVKGVAGTWRDLTDNVNQLAGNLTVQLRDVSKVRPAIAMGDLTQKITVEAPARSCRSRTSSTR
jgi:HAMP domain-containing protein